MLRKNGLKIVIDTNLWISFLISKSFQKLDHIILTSSPRIYFSTELLEELQESILKPKLAKHFGANAIEEMLFAMSDFIEIIDVKSTVAVCRDPKDNFVLSLCKDAKADYLLTGDNDLLVLNEFGKTKIVTITEFISQKK
jgi:putative PIN family toxin of toxin-antitoxin system